MTARPSPHAASLSRRTVWSSLGARAGIATAREATPRTVTDVADIPDTACTLFSLVRDRLPEPPG